MALGYGHFIPVLVNDNTLQNLVGITLIVAPAVCSRIENLNLRLKLGTDELLYGCPHGLHLEPLESEAVEHSLTAGRVKLHEFQGILGFEAPEVGDILLKLSGCLS